MGSEYFTEVFLLDFEMENFTSPAVTRRIMWQAESDRHNTDKAVSEIMVSQTAIHTLVPLAKEIDILNTAILTGLRVQVPIRVFAVGEVGQVTDVSKFVECRSLDETVIKLSKECDHLYLNGKESRGGHQVRVEFSYERLRAILNLTVWAPHLPLRIELTDPKLGQIKGWRVPIGTEESPVSEAVEKEVGEPKGYGCTVQYQRTSFRVLTRFIAGSPDGTQRLAYMLGPDWLADITHLVRGSLRVQDPSVAEVTRGSILVGREPGVTSLQVISPVSDSILAERTLTVTAEKVTLSDLQIQLVSGLSLSLRGSSIHDRVIVATCTAQDTLHTPKQEAVLSMWLQFSDDTMAPLDLYDPKDFTLSVSSGDERVVSVHQDPGSFHPLIIAEGRDHGTILHASMEITEACQRSKRKGILVTGSGWASVNFDLLGPGGSGERSGGQPESDRPRRKHHHKPQKPHNRLEEPKLHGWDSSTWEEGGVQVMSTTTSIRTAKDQRRQKVEMFSTTDDTFPSEHPFRDFGEAIDTVGGQRFITVDANFKDQASFDGSSRDDDVSRDDYAYGISDDEEFIRTTRTVSDLEIGMYVLLAVFCLAILVFLVNCVMFIFRYRHKQMPPEAGGGSSQPHSWVWPGTDGEELGRQLDMTKQKDQAFQSLPKEGRSDQANRHPPEGSAGGTFISNGTFDITSQGTERPSPKARSQLVNLVAMLKSQDGNPCLEHNLNNPCPFEGCTFKESGLLSWKGVSPPGKQGLGLCDTPRVSKRLWANEFSTLVSQGAKMVSECGLPDDHCCPTIEGLQAAKDSATEDKDSGEDLTVPSSRGKRVQFATDLTQDIAGSSLPTTRSIMVAGEEDIQWVCRDMGLEDPEELRCYMERIRENS
ncbi:transmembrane protein 132E [Latimeria chalumnae]|uniref:transmembrane protein 132E n=1 Tax=Latimeria chalumnae TaxID=7897 RepID=UPI00313CA82C